MEVSMTYREACDDKEHIVSVPDTRSSRYSKAWDFDQSIVDLYAMCAMINREALA